MALPWKKRHFVCSYCILTEVAWGRSAGILTGFETELQVTACQLLSIIFSPIIHLLWNKSPCSMPRKTQSSTLPSGSREVAGLPVTSLCWDGPTEPSVIQNSRKQSRTQKSFLTSLKFVRTDFNSCMLGKSALQCKNCIYMFPSSITCWGVILSWC